jgi:hypothetical protein
MIRDGSVSNIGCAALKKKKNPPRKRGHQLHGCSEASGK